MLRNYRIISFIHEFVPANSDKINSIYLHFQIVLKFKKPLSENLKILNIYL